MPSEPRAGAIRPTPVELIILELIAEDYSNKRIATRIKRAEFTVKSHVARLITLSHVHTRTGLAVMFVKWKYLGQSNPYWDEPDIVYSQIGEKANGQSQG